MATQPTLDLDRQKTTQFLSVLESLGEKSETTVRLFDRGEYHTAHGPDAMLIAKDYFHTLGVVKYMEKDSARVPYVCMSRQMYEATVRDLLLVRHYRVEVYARNAGGSNWSVSQRGSPGNLQQFEDELFHESAEMNASAMIMSVKTGQVDGQLTVGIAYADATLRQLGVCQFVDNEQFSNLEAFLIQVGAKECLLPLEVANTDAQRARFIVERSGVLVTDRKKGDFASKDIVQDLDRLLKLPNQTSAAALPELDLQLAMCSAGCLIKFLELLGDESNFHQFTLQRNDLSQFMKLDAAAVRALNILPSPTDGGKKTMNLVGLLNKCQTAQGSRLLQRWVKQPLMDVRLINERLDVVEVLARDLVLRETLQSEHVRKIPDLQRIAKKFQRAKGGLQDCVRLYDAVKRLEAMAIVMEGAVNGASTGAVLVTELFVRPFRELASDFEKYQRLVETVVDLELADKHEYVIKASFDEGLQDIRGRLATTERAIESEADKAARVLDMDRKTLKLESNSQLGYFFRVTRKEDKQLRSHASRFTTLETKKDGIRFTNATLASLNKQYIEDRKAYDTKQSDLVQEVLKIAGGYLEPLESFNRLIAQLDVLLSFAQVSSTAPTEYTRPVLSELGAGDTVLLGARHPCLEVQDDVSFIANDTQLVRDSSSFHIITGPNMGGKSTYIRQTGVIVLMAQIGCFVPCASAHVSVVDSILARVGAGDSQLKGISTFMAEMLETASILKTATKNSLVIVDELGRGTSTYDGFGLAWAISEHIIKEIGCFTLFATHFHELTVLAEHYSAVSNLHVTALTDNNTLTLLYRVKEGPCDQSFGIHVAEMANFPPEVVNMAKRKAAELEDFQSGDADDSDKKKARLEKQEGEEMIRQFLQQVTRVDDATLADDNALVAAVMAAKQSLLAHNHPHVTAILS